MLKKTTYINVLSMIIYMANEAIESMNTEEMETCIKAIRLIIDYNRKKENKENE